MRKHDRLGKITTVLGIVLCAVLLMGTNENNGNTIVMFPIATSCTSSPAAGSQATCSLPLDAAARWVADCVGFSAGSTTAPALTQLRVTLRDGATGAGTVIWQKVIIVTAAAAQNTQPHTPCGDITQPGTIGTAMTLEWSAGLANLFEEVSLSGHKIR